MAVDIFRWPPEARQSPDIQEIIAAAVESFDSTSEWRRFNYSKGACQQLRDRILELNMPKQLEALDLVQNTLSERKCLDICLSLRPKLD